MDIDKYLGEFEAATPSSELRRRVLRDARHPRRGRGGVWAVAAAAAFLVFANLAIEAHFSRPARDRRSVRERQVSPEFDRIVLRVPIRSASGGRGRDWYRQLEDLLEETP